MKRNWLKVGMFGMACLLLTLLPLSGACAPAPSSTPPPGEAEVKEVEIKMGALWDLSGPYASECQPMLVAQRDYIDDLNKKGGINGAKIKLLWVDTTQDMSKSMAGYEKLKGEGCVSISTSYKGESLGLKDKLNADRIPNFSLNTDVAMVRPKATEYVFYVPHTDQLAAFLEWALAEWWPKQGFDRPMKLAIMTMDTPTGRPAAAPYMLEWYKEKGIEVVGTYFVPVVPVSATTELLSARKAGADVIGGLNVSPTGGVIARDFHKLGFDPNKTLLYSASMLTCATFMKFAGEYAEGIVFHWGARFYDEDTPGMKDFLQLFRAYNGEPPNGNYYAHPTMIDNYYYGWQMTDCVARSIKIALEQVKPDKLTGDALIKYGVEKLKFDNGVCCALDFTTDTVGTSLLRLCQYKKGKPSPITDWYNAPRAGWK